MNRRAANLICYNVIESDSNRSNFHCSRIAHDCDQGNIILATIIKSTNSVPVLIKVIRISRYQSNKPRPKIITFGSISEAFNIMKNKNNLFPIPDNFIMLKPYSISKRSHEKTS